MSDLLADQCFTAIDRQDTYSHDGCHNSKIHEGNFMVRINCDATDVDSEWTVNVMSSHQGFAHVSQLLHPVRVQELVREWLKEDTPSFDYGGFVVGENVETALLLCKSPGVLAGSPFFEAVFTELGCTVKWLQIEGTFLDPADGPLKAAMVTGKVRFLLLGERVALNCLTRASGIASQARRLQQKAIDKGWHGQVAGTRKTTPGFRMVEKYSLLVGGMATHRYDLSSMIMLKDNHIWTAGNITQVCKANSIHLMLICISSHVPFDVLFQILKEKQYTKLLYK